MNERDDVFDVVGIDLGTCYSCIHVYKAKQIVPVPDDQGHYIIPSYVSLRRGQFIFGVAAKQMAERNSESTVYDLKRMISQTYESIYRSKKENMWPFKFEVDQHGLPLLVLNDSGTPYVHYPHFFITLFLWYLKGLASNFLERDVTKGVVTVPAFFTSSQRQITREAAERAGLTVLTLYEEPIAAAFAYAIASDLRTKYIMVYDFGGGTFDTSLIEVCGNVSHVIASDGHHRLGGQDLDQRMMDIFIEQLKKENPDYVINPRRLNALRKIAEEKKIELTMSDYCEVCLDTSSFDSVRFTLFRKDFESRIESLLKETVEICQRMLFSVNLASGRTPIYPNQINSIVLVGGSSRIPLAERLLKQAFPSSEIRKDINADKVVSQGACMMAVNCECINRGLPIVYSRNVTSMIIRSLGVRFKELGSVYPILCRGYEVNRLYDTEIVLQMRDVPLSVQIMECEDEMKGIYRPIGTILFPQLSRGMNDSVTIIVEMSMDSKGLLHVYLHEKGEKRGSELRVNLIGSIPPEILDEMIADLKKEIETQANLESCTRIRIELDEFLESSLRYFKLRINPLGAKSKKGRQACAKWKDRLSDKSIEYNLPVLVSLKRQIKDEIEMLRNL